MIKTNKGTLGTFTGLKILKFHNIEEFNNKKQEVTDDYFNESIVIISEDANNYLENLFRDIPEML